MSSRRGFKRELSPRERELAQVCTAIVVCASVVLIALVLALWATR